MSQEYEFENLKRTLIRFINKYNDLVKRPMDYGTGDLLYPGEMHTLEVIGGHPGITVTQAAGLLGVTKGAVSQTVKKLVGKKLVKKARDVNDDKVVLLLPDERGRAALAGHDRFHALYDAGIMQEFKDITPEELAFLQDVFRKLEESADRYLAGVR
jgi:DNA-binding MarR family transcriptional regulator